MHQLEIDIFSLYYFIVRPNKIMNRAEKIGHIFIKQSTLKKQSFQKKSYIKVVLIVKYSSQEKKSRLVWFLMVKNDFKRTNFAIFEEVVHNFGISEDDMI